MHEPHPAQTMLDKLLTRLELCVGDADKAYGEVQGSPVTMTVLGLEPPALLLGFKIQSSHPPDIDLPVDIAALVNKKIAEVSLENGIAWLSLDNLSGETSESIEGLITSFGKALAEANVRLPAGCVQCGSDSGLAVVYADGRCSRLCANCRGRIVEESIQREAELDRPGFWFALALPLILLYVSCGWMMLWWLVDEILAWTRSDTIVIGRFELLMVLALLWAIAAVMGYPIGIFLRRSGVARRVHFLASSATVLLACGIGEWLYIGTVIYRQTDLIDPVLTARMVVPFLKNYQTSWMIGKAVVAVAIIIGCYYATSVRRTVAVKL